MVMEGLNKIIDNTKDSKKTDLEEFKFQKEFAEEESGRKVEEELKSKFSEILKEHPIVIYKKEIDPTQKYSEIKLDDLKDINLGRYGGDVHILFDRDNFFSVGKNGFYAMPKYFNSRYTSHITKETFDNIVMMMNQLIERSEYSSDKKEKMMNNVVSGLKYKIIGEEELKKLLKYF